jgi:hypothetical protein
MRSEVERFFASLLKNKILDNPDARGAARHSGRA